MSALPNFNRFPGFGDLAGDSSNSNSPDYVEPVFGMDDAEALVADRLAKNGDVAELVNEVAEACALLAWIGREAVIPAHLRGAWQCLSDKSVQLCRMREREYEILNREDVA